MKRKIAILFPYFIGVLLFCFPAIYNGYPLVIPDTGTYINNGYTLQIPPDRPIAYCLFIRLTSLQFSLWFTIIFQAFITTWLILRTISFLEIFLNKKLNSILLLLVCSFFTSASWFSSQLSPDIFTAYLLLSSLLLIFSDQNKLPYFLLLIIFSFSITTHYSNFTIIFFLLVLSLTFFFRNKTLRKRTAFLLSLSFVILLSILSINKITGNGFKLSRMAPAFIIARLSETGILKMYLQNNCSNHTYKLCAYSSQLPDQAYKFLWNDDSPMQLTGGWEANETEYKEIEGNIFSSPKYLSMFAWESATSTITQLFSFSIGDGLFPQLEGANPFWKIQEHYNRELASYTSSLQSRGKLNLNYIKIAHNTFAVLLTLLFIASYKSFTALKPIKNILFFACSFILINAFFVATFANVADRLESRVFWVFPFLLFVVFLAFKKKNAERMF